MRPTFFRILSLLPVVAVLLAPLATAQRGGPYDGLTAGEWKLLGPLEHAGGNNPAAASPLDASIARLAKLKPDQDWPALTELTRHRDGQDHGWRAIPDPARGTPPAELVSFESGRIDLVKAAQAHGSADSAAFFLYMPVESPNEREITLHFGSDDGARMWWNGELLVDRNAGRATNPNDETVRVKLRVGRNHLLVKVVNGGGAAGFEMIRSGPVPQERIDGAIDKGVKLLLDRQLVDGSWQNWSWKYRDGQTALCVYTLLKCGVPAEHPAVLKALAYLRAAPTAKTYSAGCLLMALGAAHRPQDVEWMEEIVGDLLSWQNGSGGWAYPEGAPDLSITQYALLGLRAAEAAGIEIERDVWEDALRFTLSNQQKPVPTADGPEAAFHYHSGSAWTSSMTTAGLSNLGILRPRLEKKLNNKRRRELDTGIEMGLRWLGNRMQVKNTGANAWHRYYLYGLERAGALLDVKKMGGQDWYQLGARALVEDQKPNGAWEESHYDGYMWIKMHDADTCFALLFLRRATSAPVTPKGDVDSISFRSEPKVGGVELQVINRTTAVFTVRKFDRTLLPEDAGSIHAQFLVRRGGQGEWQEAGTAPMTKMTMRYRFPLPGPWQARVVVTADDGSRLISGIVNLEVEVGITPEQLAYATHSFDDLMPLRRPEFEVSSNQKGKTPALMVDGLAFTGWACAKDDKAPEFEVELRGNTKVDQILFTHLENRRTATGAARPAKLEIWLDKDKEPILVDVDPSPDVKTVVSFEKTRKFRRMRVRIIEIRNGTLGAANVGFAAIELLGKRR